MRFFALAAVCLCCWQALCAGPDKVLPRTIVEYSITSANDYPERDPKNWRLLGSDDRGKSWTLLDIRTNQIFVDRFETRHFKVTNRLEFTTYRLAIDSVRDTANSVQIAEIRVSGSINRGPIVDITPNRRDAITAQGEFAPMEVRRMAFDSDPMTKWLDYASRNPATRSSWIQWEYDGADPKSVDFGQVLTSLKELLLRARENPVATYRTSVKGTVLWANGRGDVVIQDERAAVLFRLGDPGKDLEPGMKVGIRCDSTLRKDGPFIEFSSPPVVNNDFLHSEEERSGSVFLKAGKQPIEVRWFNGPAEFLLKVEYQGRNLARQAIPDSVLWHRVEAIDGSIRWEPGLNYKAYEGTWVALPEFKRLLPVKSGVQSNFDPAVLTRQQDAAVVFSGFIDIPQDGHYTFFTKSDDGSILFVGKPNLEISVLETTSVPSPRMLTPGASLPNSEESRWVSLLGKVTFSGRGVDTPELEMSSGSVNTRVRIASGTEPPRYLLQSEVRATGIGRSRYGIDRRRVLGELIVPSLAHFKVLDLPGSSFADHAITPIGEISLGRAAEKIFRVRGTLSRMGDDWFIFDDTGSVQVHSIHEGSELLEGSLVDSLGIAAKRNHAVILEGAVFASPAEVSPEFSKNRPWITTVEAVRKLSRVEAAQGLPVKVRGVVLATCETAAILHDGTSGILVPDLSSSTSEMPEVGDYIELSGKSGAGGFAPVLEAVEVIRLGAGTLPKPVQPAIAELLNGSMDMEFVELRGTVVGLPASDTLSLAVHRGTIQVTLPETPEAALKELLHAVVRIRGPLSAQWDPDTHQVIPGQITINRAAISVDRPALPDVFSLPEKKISELLFFDATATEFQRVKVSGQIVHRRDNEFFLMNGTNGVRFIPTRKSSLGLGDQVEVVGYLRAEEDRAPVIVHSEVRRKSGGTLPSPIPLLLDSILRLDRDSTLVRVRANLLSIRRSGLDLQLELSAGNRFFVAILRTNNAAFSHLRPGSVLEVTGVYSGRVGIRADAREFNSFDLLLNQSSDVRLVHEAPWWTPSHTLGVSGALAGVLMVAFFWIRALRRKVDYHTRALKAEIVERKQAQSEAEAGREAAEAGNRAKSQFLAAMSHEIRTPMNGVIGMTNLLLDSGLNSEQRELAETVCKSGEALLAIMNDILDFSKIEAGKVALETIPFDLREVVENAVDLFAESAQRKSLELVCDLDPALPTALLGDPTRLRQVLLNILNNAIKFTERGEVILGVGLTEDQQGFEFKITDTGIGIPEEARQKLFSPFEQADNSTTRRYGGTGLGLAISSRLVELMGGTISVQSVPGAGSVFRFTAHFERQTGVRNEPALPAAAVAARALLIGASHSTLRALERILVSLGLNVTTVEEYDTTTISHTREEKFNWVFVDAELDLVQAMRPKKPESLEKLILLTPIHRRFTNEDLEAKGVAAVLAKPVKRQSVLAILCGREAVSIQRSTPPAVDPVPSGRRLLLAEDNPVNQVVASRQLKKLGYEVDIAHDGVDAVRRFQEHPYSVVLMDCQMPNMDGFEATRKLREITRGQPPVRIIAMTANAMRGDRERCLEAGMDDYIAKPVRLEELKAALDSRTIERAHSVPAHPANNADCGNQ